MVQELSSRTPADPVGADPRQVVSRLLVKDCEGIGHDQLHQVSAM